MQWIKKNRPHVPILWANRRRETIESRPESEGTEVITLDTLLNHPPSFSHLFTATSAPEILFSSQWLSKISKPTLIFDFAQPPDVENTAVSEGVEIIQLDDLKSEADTNGSARAEAIGKVERLIENSLRTYCQQQKETPLLREFSSVGPQCLKELDLALLSLQEELPGELYPLVKKWAEKLVKKQIHHSREHLRGILNTVAGPHKPTQDFF